MKYLFVFLFFIVTTLLSTSKTAFGKEEVLFDFGDEPKKEIPKKESKVEIPVKPIKKKKRKNPEQVEIKIEGNLPDYYQNRDMKNVTKHNSNQILPNNAKQALEKVAIGDTFDAVINHHIIAFNDEKAPILAVITNGKLKGYRALGEAKLNDTNESVFIEFKALAKTGQSYTMSASGLNEIGQTYFTGKYYSNESGLFAGTFISSFVAAYFEGLVPTTTNFFGQVQQDNSVDSAIKKGMAGASIETANMFREKLKKAKSFCEIKSPLKIKILINDIITEK